MQCSRCSELVPEGARFCAQCGARLEAEPADAVGQIIGDRYRVLRLVGEGGVGRVYEAEQLAPEPKRKVALKLLKPEWSQTHSVVARFTREAATAARLRHEHTVRVYDFGSTEDGTPFIAMEYLEGRSLAALLDGGGALAPARVLDIVGQLAGGLDEAHGLGITHRDLKPANVLLLPGAGGRDSIKLLDFGIAKLHAALDAEAVTKLTELGTFVGTPAYMSPEQFGAAPVGPASDIYSLGVTTYQMLAGRLPFTADSLLEWARAHATTAPPPLDSSYGAGPIPRAMQRAVLRALSKDPRERPASATEFARELGSGDRAVELEAGAASGHVDALAQTAAAGDVSTAPMLHPPEFEAPGAGARAVNPTLPMARLDTQPDASTSAAEIVSAPSRARRRVGWWVAAGLLATTLGAIGYALSDRVTDDTRVAMTAQGAPPEAAGPAGAPEAVVIHPETPPVPEPVPPSLPAPEPAAPRTPQPASPARRPPPAPAATPGPQPAPPAAPVPLPPVPPLPAAPELPVPPWTTAGACERCLEELASQNRYAVVTATAHHLACNDRAARERCEARMREVAPALAEQAARAGDCPAAWATLGAALNVGARSEQFQALDKLCPALARP